MTVNDPNVCVKGSTFACVCASCDEHRKNTIELIKSGGTPPGVSEEVARAWQDLFNGSEV